MKTQPEFYEDVFSQVANDTVKYAVGKDGKPMPIPKDRLPEELKDKTQDEPEKPTFLWMPRTTGIVVASISAVGLIILSVVLYKKFKK